MRRLLILFVISASAVPLSAGGSGSSVDTPDLPDREVVAAYERAARQNVLAAVNAKVFSGYWSVCADGQGFGYGNSYPSLDGHQMADALLWLGQVEVVKANWDYVRSFQRADGLLPLAILPAAAGKKIGVGNALSTVADNGGLYEHWVPGNPLGALASPTYIQNADVLFRRTLDQRWLAGQLGSINLAADYLASLTSEQGAVRGAGYYVERPTRIESDGVTQCHAVDAFRRVAALNRVVGEEASAKRHDALAERIRRHFVTRFWVGDHYAEYLHPERGLISSHGLTDVDWAAVALDVATPEQRAIVWPRLKDEARFHYGGMPTAISTRPETYEAWEFTHPDRHDLAAMGRVWYVEAQARARMGDAEGLLAGIRKVCETGRRSGYYWRERYHPDGKGGAVPAGAETYCEYPANLIRIVQRFVLGVDLRLDGVVVLAPTVTEAFWREGFGQTLAWRGRTLRYRMFRDEVTGTYAGAAPQRLGVRLARRAGDWRVVAKLDDKPVEAERDGDLIFVTLASAPAGQPCKLDIRRIGSDGS
ncbi:MAG: hypothetical protein JXQ73_07905 [Phycisphaerae bacterium]|nr:hypothetical protein [Phycisphaerae bacterium]